MRRRDFITVAGLVLSGCAPTVQQAWVPGAGFRGPRLETGAFVSFDGARLPMTRWEAEGEPWGVVVALHGFNDYANAFHLAAPFWAANGVTTYAFDQRGFGRADQRGVWAGDTLMAEDLRTLAALVRAAHPNATLIVVGESMGGAVAVRAFASNRPPAADRLVLMAPAVWGWSRQPLPSKTLLWLTAHVAPAWRLEPPKFVTDHVRPTDNIDELRAMGADPLMIWGSRVDTLFGLTRMMQGAWAETGRLEIPTAYLYGAKDDVIPKRPSFEAASRLPAGGRTAYYPRGHHLLMRDRQGPSVWADALSFMRDPAAPWPSGAGPIPARPAPGVAARSAPE